MPQMNKGGKSIIGKNLQITFPPKQLKNIIYVLKVKYIYLLERK